MLKNGSTLFLFIDANETSTELRLYEAMRHGFGHVFGLQHNSSTFMSPITRYTKRNPTSCRNSFGRMAKPGKIGKNRRDRNCPETSKILLLIQ